MKEQNIEKLFKDGLENFETDVNPNVWSGIEQGLNAPVTGNPVSGGSVASKSAGFLGKIGLKGLFLASAATVTVAGALFYLMAEKNDSAPVKLPAVSQIEREAPPVLESKNEPAASAITPSVESKNVVSENTVVQKEQKHDEVHKINASPIPSVTSPEKETTSNSPSEKPAVPANTNHQKEATASADPVSQATNSDINENDVTNQPAIIKDDLKEDDFDGIIENYLVPDENGNQKLQNIFTPDNDGKNDFLRIKTVNLKSLEVTIFDDRGNKIYSWRSLNGEWDGKLSNGSDARPGRYFYTLNGETTTGKICIAQSPLILTRSLK